MTSQPASSSTFSSPLPSQLRLDGDTCPSCGQQIPHDRLEEINGRIAAREREQVVAITAKLEHQHVIERAQAEAKAKADLELERRQSTVREAMAREEARRAAEVVVNEKLAEAERSRQSAMEEAEAARKLAEQLAAGLQREMEELRQIMEKAKDDAVNAEKAKAFEEAQKLSTKVNELQRALEKKTNEELGEGAEVDLFEALRKEFPDDSITRIAKGAPGADIRHVVMLRGKECGTILYDSKNHNQFRSEHITKLKADQLSARAEHAILSTHKFPQGTRQMHIQDGILLANPARVVSIATIIRQHLVQIHTLRLSSIERERKTVALYEFITSEGCTQLLGRIDERASNLLEQQEKEIRWHQNNWQKQGESYRAIQKAKIDLENEISRIIGSSADSGIPETS